jgi:ABC-2 type transport system permease protein
MTLLNVERIKLFSTRSPYWCLGLIPVIGVGITLLTSLSDSGAGAGLASSQRWVGFAMTIVMVMAALSITTEYRFGTIRNSFLAMPGRTSMLVAKAALLGIISFVVVELTSLATYFLGKAVHGSATLPTAFDLTSATDYRAIWGPGLISALAAVLAVGVGTLIRQSAGAIALLLLWPLLVENLFLLFGSFGRNVQPWLPFGASGQFFAVNEPNPFQIGIAGPNWWQGGLIFAGTALVLVLLALLSAKKRDA